MKTAVLYRHFDSDGDLLYVGISHCAVQRLSGHKQYSHWFSRIARIEITHFVDRESALIAEALAIAKESPKFNIKGKPFVGKYDSIDILVGSTKLKDAERALILATIDYFDGDKHAAAKVLKLSLKTIYNKLVKYRRAA